MSIKSRAGATFHRHVSSVERVINKIDLLRKLKLEQDRLIDANKLDRARVIGEKIYELECKDELDVIASYTGLNSLGRSWSF